jgi:hypothetical protein
LASRISRLGPEAAATLTKTEIETALRLKRKAYALLKWFQAHLAHAQFPTPEAHDAMGTGAVARIWLEQNLLRVPA